jgi:pectinesterase
MIFTRSLPLLATFVGISFAGLAAPPPGAVVIKAGSDLGKAFKENTGKTVYLEGGTYKGPVVITGKITVYGATESPDGYHGNKATITINRSQEGGFSNPQTAAVQVNANGVKFYNVNFENTWGLKDKVKNQALAVSTQGDEIGFYGCKFDGWQDTIETEGPGGKLGKQVFVKCMIAGTTDFIFGKTAAAWFEDCDIRVKNKPLGYITGKWSSTGRSYTQKPLTLILVAS